MITVEPEGIAEVRKVTVVQFGILSPEKIRAMSVAEIKTAMLKEVRAIFLPFQNRGLLN